MLVTVEMLWERIKVVVTLEQKRRGEEKKPKLAFIGRELITVSHFISSVN